MKIIAIRSTDVDRIITGVTRFSTLPGKMVRVVTQHAEPTGKRSLVFGKVLSVDVLFSGGATP